MLLHVELFDELCHWYVMVPCVVVATTERLAEAPRYTVFEDGCVVNVGATTCASQCAYSVMSADGEYGDPPFPTFVPPDDAVYQPLKLYPLLVGVGSITTPIDVLVAH